MQLFLRLHFKHHVHFINLDIIFVFMFSFFYVKKWSLSFKQAPYCMSLPDPIVQQLKLWISL